MNAPPSDTPSTRPYLLRALHEWCSDNGFTPYIAVHVDRTVQVPMEFVKNDEIVLNVGFEATAGLKLGNETVEFRARFGGVSRDIVVPVDHVVAIYARENGQGMAFPMPTPAAAADIGATAPPARPGLHLAGADDNAAAGTDAPPPAPDDGAPTADGEAGAAGTVDGTASPGSATPPPVPPPPPTPPPRGSRPSLKRIK